MRAEPEALVASASGVIAEVNAVAGQIAQPNAILFQIVEPTRLWIEALSFDALTGADTATARTSAGRSINLTYVGAGLADRNQAVPVHFKVESDAAGLRLGQFVTVLAATEERDKGSLSRVRACCAAPTARTSSTSTPRPSGSSRARFASSHSTANGFWSQPACRLRRGW